MEEILTPYLQILSSFRDSVRIKARELKAFDVLQECDRLRDDILPNVGVRLEDKEGMSGGPRAPPCTVEIHTIDFKSHITRMDVDIKVSKLIFSGLSLTANKIVF